MKYRRFLRFNSFAAIALVAAAAPAMAQMPPAAPLVAHALNGGAYWVTGGTANVGFVIGDQGVVAIDAEMSRAGANDEIAQIAKLTTKLMTHIIITHADPDHVGGLIFYPADTSVVMQENCRSEVIAAAADPKAPPM